MTTSPVDATVAGVGSWIQQNDPNGDVIPAVIFAREVELDSPDALSALRRLLGLLDALGRPDMLTDARASLQREKEINQYAGLQQAAAVKRVSAARDAALRDEDPASALEELATALFVHEMWTPRPGEDSVLLAEARKLARASLQRAVMQASGQGDATYRLLQDMAAESIRAIAEAPLPPKIFSTAEPAALVMRSADPESWTTMMKHGDRFGRIHEAGALVRSLGGVQTELPGAAPSSLAWRYRNWQAAQNEREELRRFARPLRLRYACDHGWEPGLWRADQIDGNHVPQAKPKRKLLGR